MIKLQNENNLKILIVVSDLNKGGVQRATINFAKGFKSLGCDIKILAFNSGGIREKDLFEESIDFYIAASPENIKNIKQWKPSLVFLQSNGVSIDLFKLLRKEFEEAVIFEKNVFNKPSPWEDLIDASFQMSNWGKWRYLKRYSGNKNKVFVIPNPVEVKRFSPSSDEVVKDLKIEYGIPANDLIIGRVGQFYSSKWSQLLIDLFEYLKEEFDNISLLLINPPEDIVERVNKSIYLKNILIIDKINDDQKLSIIYSAIDIFVLIADRGESFGNVIAESLLCETPVLALSTPWADNAQCEVIGNLEGGLIATSPKGILRGAKLLIKDVDLRNRLGKKGRDKVLKNYEYKIVCQNILNIYKKIERPKIEKDLTSQIINIYSDAIDKPNIISIFLLRFPLIIKLTKVTSGYQKIKSFFKKELYLFHKKQLKKYFNTNNN